MSCLTVKCTGIFKGARRYNSTAQWGWEAVYSAYLFTALGLGASSANDKNSEPVSRLSVWTDQEQW